MPGGVVVGSDRSLPKAGANRHGQAAAHRDDNRRLNVRATDAPPERRIASQSVGCQPSNSLANLTVPPFGG
jgi:hypothetical protein